MIEELSEIQKEIYDYYLASHTIKETALFFNATYSKVSYTIYKAERNNNLLNENSNNCFILLKKILKIPLLALFFTSLMHYFFRVYTQFYFIHPFNYNH